MTAELRKDAPCLPPALLPFDVVISLITDNATAPRTSAQSTFVCVCVWVVRTWSELAVGPIRLTAARAIKKHLIYQLYSAFDVGVSVKELAGARKEQEAVP